MSKVGSRKIGANGSLDTELRRTTFTTLNRAPEQTLVDVLLDSKVPQKNMLPERFDRSCLLDIKHVSSDSVAVNIVNGGRISFGMSIEIFSSSSWCWMCKNISVK